jgi:hypothetical protein
VSQGKGSGVAREAAASAAASKETYYNGYRSAGQEEKHAVR